RWSARLRAWRRPGRPGVLRRDLLILRQPGAGSLQATHGPSGLLLRLLPPGQARLTFALTEPRSSVVAQAHAPAPLTSSERPEPTGAFTIPGAWRRPPGLDSEHLPVPEPLAVPAVPDGHPARPLDLPRPVAADECRVLVQAERREVARCLEHEHRREWLRKRVVVGDHRGARNEIQASSPAERPGKLLQPEVEVSRREGHRAGRATDECRPAFVRREDRGPDPRPEQRLREVPGLPAGQVDEVRLADRLGRGVVIGVEAIADE